jgi:ABC-2 type transport system permease protein
MTTIFVIGLELKRSTAAAWLEVADGGLFAALAGKFLPYTIAFLIVAGAFNLWPFRLVGIPQQGSPALLLVAAAAMVVAYQSVGVLSIAVAGNMRLGLSTAAIYCGPVFAFGGVTFPTLAMTRGAKLWSKTNCP